MGDPRVGTFADPPVAIGGRLLPSSGGARSGQENESLRLLLDGAKDCAMFMLDRGGGVQTWNAGAQAVTGYVADEIVGAPFASFYVPEDVEAARPQRALTAAEMDGRYEEEGWRVRKDGSRFWAALTLTTLWDGAETPVGYAVVSRDLTDERVTGPFRLAVEAAPAGMIMVDDAGRIVMANAHVEKIFGYARQELIGHPFEMLVRERLRIGPPQFGGARRGLFGRRKDGTEVPIELGLNPLQTAEGRFVLNSVVDLSERKRGEEERDRLLGEVRGLHSELEERVQARTAELEAVLREREVLLQEVHHRVKNNLQVISSLISLQARAHGADASRDALEDCRARIQTIALIHEKLNHAHEYARLPFSEFARDLARDVFDVAGVSRNKVSLDLAVEHVTLAVDKAIPCGLILNELITNAVRHAFPEGRAGTVRVELARAGAGLRLAVSDDGIGLPDGLDIARSPSLGLQIVQTLAKQLDARLEVEVAGGTRFRMTVLAEE